MSLDAANLLHPAGRIHPDLFPERSVEELLQDVQEWCDEGLALAEVAVLDESEQDRAAKAWAYHRAFDAACVAMAANPASHAQSDAGSSTYTKDQRDTICGLALRFLAEFNELAPRNATSDRYTGGQTIIHDYAW